ncbi:MAG: fused MFS/spermidine synthase [candidate division NC10 bacterium]|nr:fused MFS/spermidine synthase [candidate division NC10 bacterium]
MAEVLNPAWNEAAPATSISREIRQISNAVIACFLISGAVGLIYEVLWIRLLGLVFGHTVFAVTTVLASFMGGLGLGSYLFGRIADRSTHLLRFYGSLEIGIGAYCLALPTLLGWVSELYLWVSRSLELGYIAFSAVQFVLVALLLIVPTCLMGATLPVLARFFVREETTLGRQVGILYSVNTLGAVFGALLAGYWLVPALGIQTTIRLAVVLNVGVGGLVLVFERHLQRLAALQAAAKPATATEFNAPAAGPAPALTWPARVVAVGFGASGAASMIYEVTWSRALTLSIGSSTYAFTAMLVAFLCGIAGGSWAFAALAGRRRVQLGTFGLLQITIGLCGVALLPMFGRMPIWFLELFQFSQAAWFVQSIQFGVSFAVMLLPTLFIGATFPCAVRILARGVDRIGNDTGWIYAVNTAGAILGTVLAGFVGVPLLGIQWTMRIGIWVNLVIGVGVLLAARRPGGALLRGLALGTAGAAVAGTIVLPSWDPALMSSGVAIYGPRYLPLIRAGEFGRSDRQAEVIYYRDGISATVSVHRDGPGLSLRVNGKTDAGNTSDMHTQLFSGHIPMLLHPNPKRVLVIGLGSGVTAGAVAQYPVDQIDIIEIEPAVAEAARFFERENRNVLADPRVRMIISDGRTFLLNARIPYDVIISEPSNPWIRGLATLFTREFYGLVRSRLAPDGIMLQWIQGYGIAPEDLRMVAATFHSAFPDSTLWTTMLGDNFLVGAAGPLLFPLARIQARYDASPVLREDFARVGLHSPVGLLADHLLGGQDLARYAGQGALNTDDTLWLEFSAPRSLYDIGIAELNHRILSSYRSASLPPLTPADHARADTPEGRHAIGRAFLGKGLFQEAESEFARAGALDTLHVPSRLEEAELLLRRGMILKGVRMLEQVLARRPQEPRAHFLLGLAHQQQGMAEEALASLKRAAALAPGDIEYRLRLAALFRDRGELDQARAEYEAARELRPTDPAVLIPAADLRLTQGDTERALTLLQPVLADLGAYPSRTRAEVRHLVGLIHLRARRFADAVAALEAAVRLAPLQTAFRLDLSLAYEASGDLERAAATLERLLAFNPNHLVALQRLNTILGRLAAAAS